jgi:alpha-1,2-glucosyltransferase
LLAAFALSLFPLNFFFQYLYYTDIGSTCFILIAYYQQLKGSYKLSALSGLIAVLYRQTNIVWLCFCLFQLILLNADNLVKNQESAKIHIKKNTETGTINVTQQRHQKASNTFELLVRNPSEAFGTTFDIPKYAVKLYREDFWGKKLVYHDLIRSIDINVAYPYFLVILMFIAFIFFNDGIVVGDRSNHKASFHLCQIFYFFSFSIFFSLSTVIFSYKKLKNLIHFFLQNSKMLLIFVLPTFCLLVKHFSFEHPFLLADNRHFTFYIWSKLMRRYEFVRYLLTPIYLACMYLVYRNLAGKTIGWFIAFAVCLLISVVPQQLIEFRYFIIPYYIYRFNSISSSFSYKEIISEIIFNLILNTVTIYIFLYRTFYWSNAPGEIQRFMW